MALAICRTAKEFWRLNKVLTETKAKGEKAIGGNRPGLRSNRNVLNSAADL